jgi:hypothetical protein
MNQKYHGFFIWQANRQKKRWFLSLKSKKFENLSVFVKKPSGTKGFKETETAKIAISARFKPSQDTGQPFPATSGDAQDW